MSTALTKIMNRLQPAQQVRTAPVLTKLAAAEGVDASEYIEKLATALEFAADDIIRNTAAPAPTGYAPRAPIEVGSDRLVARLREKIALKQSSEQAAVKDETQSALQRIIGRLNETVDPITEVAEIDDPIETAIAQAAEESPAVVEHVQQAAALPSASLADVLTAALEAKGTSDSASAVADDSSESVAARATESAKTASASGKGPVTVEAGSKSFKDALAARRLSGGK